jgi:hypothetical protein
MIGVKNKSEVTIKARYNGEDFTFSPGVTVACSELAAAHIFGYGEKDKTRALHRLGWMTSAGQYEQGLQRLDDFAFLAVEETKFKEEAPTTLHLPKKGMPQDTIPMSKAPEGERQVAVGR